MMGTKVLTTVGPEAWRNSTLKGIKLSQTIAQKSDKNCDIGRSFDPLPHLRDTVAQLSNDEIHRYTREVRGVVSRLRESLLETNEEIKSLTRGKEAIEKTLEHTRKDLKLNKDSQDIRLSRPAKEREHDGADDLLNAERSHLLNCKKALEAQLRSVQQQLFKYEKYIMCRQSWVYAVCKDKSVEQTTETLICRRIVRWQIRILDHARKRLFACLEERSRVLDLLCHTVSSAANGTNTNVSANTNHRSKSMMEGRISRLGASQADPLGPYTPEVDQTLADASDARARSAYLRKELRDGIERTENLKHAAHRSVNDGLTQKVSETVTLKQHLGVTLGENRHAIHRAQRWYDATDKARSYSVGPVMSADLTTREKLDRPTVRIFQRHPGTQLPEAQQIIQGSDGLLQSLTATSRNIGLLRLANLRLYDDIRTKSAASGIDSGIIRLRRRRSDHRWNLGEAF